MREFMSESKSSNSLNASIQDKIELFFTSSSYTHLQKYWVKISVNIVEVLALLSEWTNICTKKSSFPMKKDKPVKMKLFETNISLPTVKEATLSLFLICFKASFDTDIHLANSKFELSLDYLSVLVSIF